MGVDAYVTSDSRSLAHKGPVMRPARTIAGAAVVVSLTAAASAGPGAGPDGAAAAAPVPVVVELFTSQGCSSCPPADSLLSSLVRNQPVPGALIVPLSEHVDYWDRLGWRDPFSSPRFTARQRDYAAAFDASSIYTPQVVVDGRVGLVGSRGAEVRAAIRDARDRPRVPVRIEVAGHPNSRVVEVAAAIGPERAGVSAEALGVWLAITESGLMTDVRAGENRFRRLRHTGVVRHLERIDTLLPGAVRDGSPARARLRLDPGWTRGRLHAVVFLQERESRRIVGAARAAVDHGAARAVDRGAARAAVHHNGPPAGPQPPRARP